MIRRIYVDNYKCLVNFELRLEELTLLVGPNGVGKSAVLSVMLALRQLLHGTAKVEQAGIFSSGTRTRWQDVAVQVVEVEVELAPDVFVYRLEVEHEASAFRASVRRESLSVRGRPLFEFDAGTVALYDDEHAAGATHPAERSESALARVPAGPNNRRLTSFLEFMRKLVVCGLYPGAVAAESSREEAGLDPVGANFTAWYRHISQEHQELMPEYTEALKEVLEGFRGIRLERVGGLARAFKVVFDQAANKYELRLDELSDGQRALLVLYALVYLTAGQGGAIFLDEPDNYVALAELQPWLVRLSDACGETIPQVVLCSHHPELIDYLGGERGLALSREASGVTTVKRLADVELGATMRLSEVIARGWE
jgi:predicted ATPase